VIASVMHGDIAFFLMQFRRERELRSTAAALCSSIVCKT